MRQHDRGVEEIEKGFSAVKLALGAPPAPFFRFPFLKDPKDQLDYLGTRNIAIFSHDLDSFDFKMRKPEDVIKSVMTKLERKGKGIILMHDFQQATAKAVPDLLNVLKAKGYKVVHMKAKTPLTTIAAVGRGGQERDQGRDRRRPADLERDPHDRRGSAPVGHGRNPDRSGQEISTVDLTVTELRHRFVGRMRRGRFCHARSAESANDRRRVPGMGRGTKGPLRAL